MSGKPIVVKDGRFGPYVTDGETNASLRKGDTVENITIERAAELLQIRRDAGPAKKARKGAKKAPSKKRREEDGQEGGQEGPGQEGRQAHRPAVSVLIAGDPRPTRNVDPMAEQRQVPLPGLEQVGHDAPTEPSPAVGSPDDKPGLHVRLFGSSQFFRLWLAQVASATGDWLGFLAIAALAGRHRPGLAGGRGRPRDVGPHRARLLPRPGGRRDRRPVRPQAGDGHLRPRPCRRPR